MNSSWSYSQSRRFMHIQSRSLPLSIGKRFVIAIPTCGYTWQPFGRRRGVQWFISNTRIFLHECSLSPSANVSSAAVDARICSVMFMDDSSGVGQPRSISWMSGSLKPCTHHLALALYLSDHIRLRGVNDVHRLEIEYSMPFGFDCFRKLRLLVFPGYLVGVPPTEIKFSMLCARLGRRNRKSSVFLASSDVEASSLLPCLLDVHRSFTFGRHPSSVSVTVHRLF